MGLEGWGNNESGRTKRKAVRGQREGKGIQMGGEVRGWGIQGRLEIGGQKNWGGVLGAEIGGLRDKIEGLCVLK